MLLVHRDTIGNLTAAIDYQVVNDHGQPDPDGRYIWIEQLEINFLADGKEHIHRFIQEIAELQPLALGAYWQRRDRRSRLYWFHRMQLMGLKEVRI